MQSIIQQAIEHFEKIERRTNISTEPKLAGAVGGTIGFLKKLLPAERAMIEKEIGDAWDAGQNDLSFHIDKMLGNTPAIKPPDKQTYINDKLK